MKKNIYIGAMATMAMLLCVSCSQQADEPRGSEEGKLLRISEVSIDGTRAAFGDLHFQEGDSIGIFISREGEAYGNAQNIRAICSGPEGFTWTLDRDIMLPDDASTSMWINAYYPYSSHLTDTTLELDCDPVTTNVLASFMGRIGEDGSAKLQFHHLLTWLSINFISPETSVEISDVRLIGNINAYSGFTNDRWAFYGDDLGYYLNRYAVDILPLDSGMRTSVASPAENAVCEVQIREYNNAPYPTLSFKVNGEQREVEVPAAHMWTACHYVLNVTINPSDPTVKLVIDPKYEIENWIEDEQGSYNIADN